MKPCNYDERQTIIHSQTLKHCFILLITLTLVNAFLKENGITLIAGVWDSILIVILSCAVGLIELACRGVFPFKGRVFYPLTAVVLVSLVLAIVDFMRGEVLIAQGMLTENGTFLLIDVCLLIACVVYFVKRTQERKAEKSEER